MKKTIKKALLFALTLLPIAVVAGVFTGFYQLDTISEEIAAQAVAQLGSADAIAVVGAVQTVAYALFCGFFGYILADKIGLWKPVEFKKKGLVVTLITGVIGGGILSFDHWVFGGMYDGIRQANAASLTVSGVGAAVLYGGIIEEVMMRLFFMSLIAFVIWKVFSRKYDRENIPTGVFAAANIIAAAAFAAGHLPVTIAMFGQLTPLLLLRCFAFNGGLGMAFGMLYRKYGIVYAMAAHALCHIVFKTVLMIFI